MAAGSHGDAILTARTSEDIGEGSAFWLSITSALKILSEGFILIWVVFIMGLREIVWVRLVMKLSASHAVCGFPRFDAAAETGMISRW
ncbi:MAG: hypothetical protein ACREWG_16895, partial [Gammaproteobacteria bacterium]